jgi:hypothetical protein
MAPPDERPLVESPVTERSQQRGLPRTFGSLVDVTVAAAIAVVAFAAAAIWTPVALASFVIVLALVVRSRIRPTIDRRGVTVHGLGRRLPRLVIALDEIRAASTPPLWRRVIGPTERGRLEALNSRRPALLVEFGDDRKALISVDHASEGADVLNGLVAQLRSAARSSAGADA